MISKLSSRAGLGIASIAALIVTVTGDFAAMPERTDTGTVIRVSPGSSIDSFTSTSGGDSDRGVLRMYA